jgi:hypothetical protein
MAKLAVRDLIPAVTLTDIDGATVEFPAVFSRTPSTVVFFTAAAGHPGVEPR